jgi:hypothetical protein
LMRGPRGPACGFSISRSAAASPTLAWPNSH